MPGKSENSNTWRSDIMRRIAAVHVEIDRLPSAGLSAEERGTRAKVLKEQLAALMKKFLA
jgi:hypothetical protein